MFESNLSIHCEIVSRNRTLSNELKIIARTCAIDLRLSFPLETIERCTLDQTEVAHIVFNVPAQLAIAGDSIWKLACRVALFCPQARITTCITAN